MGEEEGGRSGLGLWDWAARKERAVVLRRVYASFSGSGSVVGSRILVDRGRSVLLLSSVSLSEIDSRILGAWRHCIASVFHFPLREKCEDSQRPSAAPHESRVWGRPAVSGLKTGTDGLVPVLPARCHPPNHDVGAS